MKSFVGKGYTIYKHTNRENGKCYIGQTKNEDLTRRWCGGHGYKENRHFFAAIKKYGWESFAHEILETGLSESEANDREQYYIALYRSNDHRYGYNIRPGGQERTTFTEEGLKAIRECSKGGRNGNARAVAIFNLNGERVFTAETSREACNYIGVNQATMSRHLGNKRGTCGGYICRFADEVQGINQLPKEQCYFQNEQRSQLRPVGQYDFSGNLLAVYTSRKQANAITGIKASDISSCCGQMCKSAGGYIWRNFTGTEVKIEPLNYKRSEYVDSLQKAVDCFDAETMALIGSYQSIRKASEETKITEARIGRSLKCGMKTGNVVWKYRMEKP